jgi:uncharacterized protein YbjT (DUF2867 family)
MHAIVLGGTGGLGKLVCAELERNGIRARGVGRRDGDARDPEVVTRLAAGARAIVNCAGASVALGLGHGWRGYRAVDTPIGLAAISAARQTGARLVYVAVHHPPALAGCAYVDAHERVVAAMSDLDAVIVRPTGFFSAYAALLSLARRGILVDVGDGRARTNPIDERDLAAIVAESVTGEGPREIAAGGPEVLARRAIFEIVAAASGRRVRILGMPVWLARASGAALRLVHPRMGQFTQFAAGLARHDVIAPALGTYRLADYLAGTQASAAA